MSNRIAQYLPVTNRIPVFAPARGMSCGSFVALSIGSAIASAAQTTSVYEIAVKAAHQQVTAKRRFRASSSTSTLSN